LLWIEFIASDATLEGYLVAAQPFLYEFKAGDVEFFLNKKEIVNWICGRIATETFDLIRDSVWNDCSQDVREQMRSFVKMTCPFIPTIV
jgi:hypothetical protein